MARKVFFSFHYDNDCWRTSQVRNIGVLEGNKLASDNRWEEITKGGDKAIASWIDNEMYGRSCAIVLVGEKTAKRKWIDHEIKKAWADGRGVLGIYIHNLKNSQGFQSNMGLNPFSHFNINGTSLDKIVKCYNPPFTTSTYVYDHIRQNIENWIETAIAIRKQY